MRMLSRPFFLVLLVAALAASGCGSDGGGEGADAGGRSATSDTTAGGMAATGGDKVEIKSFAYQPANLSAKAGATITVTNRDSAPHTLTADDRSFDTGNLGEGASSTITLPKAGTIKYHCEIHNYMTGVIQAA